MLVGDVISLAMLKIVSEQSRLTSAELIRKVSEITNKSEIVVQRIMWKLFDNKSIHLDNEFRICPGP